MDFLCPSYQAIATREFQKILNLGAAGWLFDEVCHHGPVEYSFSPNHGYAPPGYIYNGDLPMSRQLRKDAEFRDTLGAEVISDGSHRHSVFITPAGKRAVVVVNEESKKSITANVNLLNPGRLVVATP